MVVVGAVFNLTDFVSISVNYNSDDIDANNTTQKPPLKITFVDEEDETIKEPSRILSVIYRFTLVAFFVWLFLLIAQNYHLFNNLAKRYRIWRYEKNDYRKRKRFVWK